VLFLSSVLFSVPSCYVRLVAFEFFAVLCVDRGTRVMKRITTYRDAMGHMRNAYTQWSFFLRTLADEILAGLGRYRGTDGKSPTGRARDSAERVEWTELGSVRAELEAAWHAGQARDSPKPGRVWFRFSAVLQRENVKHPPNRLRFLRFHKTSFRSAAAFLTKTRESDNAGRIVILQNAAFVRRAAANIKTKQAPVE
jgi:hypothetical protein